jgi:hypothetical protein
MYGELDLPYWKVTETTGIKGMMRLLAATFVLGAWQ